MIDARLRERIAAYSEIGMRAAEIRAALQEQGHNVDLRVIYRWMRRQQYEGNVNRSQGQPIALHLHLQ